MVTGNESNVRVASETREVFWSVALLMSLFDVFVPVNLEALHLVFGFPEACTYQLISRNLLVELMGGSAMSPGV